MSSISKFSERPFVAPALLLALGFILAGSFISNGLKALRDGGNTLTATGSAKQAVTSDIAKLRGDIVERVFQSDVQKGYAQSDANTKILKEYIIAQGITDKEFTVSAPQISEYYDYSNNGVQKPRQFEIRRTIQINSTNLNNVDKVANNLSTIATKGIFFQSYGVEYYYSKLSDLRKELLKNATEDAKGRATQIAKGTGDKIGNLKKASSGVVQVLAPNSQEITDYGTYDTTTKEKEVSITVKAEFRLK